MLRLGQKVSQKPGWMWLIGLSLFMIVLGLIWRFTPLAHYVRPRSIFRVMREFAQGNPFAFWVFAVTIAVGNLVLIPINFLLIAVAMVYPGWKGFLCGLLGAVLAALLQAAVGRWLGAERARAQFGEKFEIISSEIRERGVWAVTILSLLPIAPNAATNVVAGICRIPTWQLVVGTVVGFLPGLTVMNLLSRQMRALFKHPSVGVVLASVGLLGLFFLSSRIARRYKARMSERFEARGEPQASGT